MSTNSNQQFQANEAMLRRAQRQMIVSGVLFLIMAIAVAVAVFAFLERDDATQQAHQANTQAAVAQENAATSEAVRQEAVRSAEGAGTQAAIAAAAAEEALAAADSAATQSAETERDAATQVAIADENAATASAGEAEARDDAEAAATQAAEIQEDAATRVALAEADALTAEEDAQAAATQAVEAEHEAATRVAAAEHDAATRAAETEHEAATRVAEAEHEAATQVAVAEDNAATAAIAQAQAEAAADLSATQAAAAANEAATQIAAANEANQRDEPPPPQSSDGTLVAHIGSNPGNLAEGGVDVWTFAGESGQVITIETDADWDTVLALYSPEGLEVAYDDDRDFPTDVTSLLPDIRLGFTGTYEIEVYGFEVEDAGPYTLIITEEASASSQSSASIAAPESLDDFYQNSSIVYGPESGTIRSENVFGSTLFTEVFAPDFVLEIDVVNGSSNALVDWDMVISFRSSYALLIASDGLWAFVQDDGFQSDFLDGGVLTNMTTGPFRTNTIQLGAWANTAIFAVNGQEIATVDVSDDTGSGEIWITSGLLDETTDSESVLTYENFTIRAVSGTSSSSVDDLYALGAAAYDDEDYAVAIPYFDEVLAADPRFVEAYMLRGLSYFFEGNYDRAVDDFSRAINLEGWGWAYNWRGWVYFLQGDALSGLDDLNSAVAAGDEDVFYYMDRAVIEAHLGDDDAAQADYLHAVEIDAGYTFDLDSLDSGIFAAEEYEYLAETYTLALDVSPDNFIALMHIGNSRANLANYESAIDAYKQVIILAPEFAPAFKSLGDVYYSQGQDAAAGQMYNQYLELVGDDAPDADAVRDRLHALDLGDL